ncbi:alpha/beta hydrolase [Sulfitobacter geojensis]|uniref:Alpha/beta fold hydrolase n=1 Tax=Sulfitobacter geojensis TaxID=1342299 RepID=A0AAE2W1K5_9RHOB|nr:alpha/beta fold hydrolase [Sulfitobacter geojensis]MBM1691128.1 alpha/beta fold hydrolase [Sulfitobacter geojensis]MBM1695194.1 alpha/beta fold hydrolase [Sulfitobacter geojensis]MBM1707294.1 alpha/beta fold hydrolase [Sulfitobacter geojensis]MBM1711444.1 alpha/beta fold hydrolase [Sulfitobacter geojensis]MBM1715419.1 alpha/beta fold hydrolase [Sulfitobacter geojensis]
MENDSTAPFLLGGSSCGVLLLHGFTSTPQSVRYVGHRLHARSGATVMAPLLAGHGTTPEDFAQTGFRDWLKSAEDALEALSARCTTICVAGLSLGGTIALNLSIRRGDLVDRVATINGSTGLYSPQQMKAFFDGCTGDFQPGIGSDIKNPGYKETCYDRIPNAVTQERYVLVTATGQMLPLLDKPLLILQSRTDHVVSPENGKRIEGAVASRSITFCWLENSYHVATLDNDRDLIVQELTNFLTAE